MNQLNVFTTPTEPTLDATVHTPERSAQQRSAVQIKLLKAPIYRQKQPELWQWLERDQYQVRQYFGQIALSLVIDEAEGYAFLRQIELSEAELDHPVLLDTDNTDGKSSEQAKGAMELPRLIAKRTLPFAQSLLLVMIRKRLAEHDSEESSPRLVITRNEVHQWLMPYFSNENNEVKQQREFNSLLNKVAELGFIRPLKNYPDEFEVQRIIKAFIDAEHISQQLTLLTEYAKGKQEQQQAKE